MAAAKSLDEALDELDIDDTPEPTIQNLLDQKSLKWIFVGGKGGVGKTTVSSCLAVEMSKVRNSVLLISTDPAHNLSDAFGQKFTKYPTLINGFTNLSAMEIDPTFEHEEADVGGQSDPLGLGSLGLQDMISAIPGIDEAMGFAEVMKQVQSMQYSVIIFDTAPTGHTLRFLSFPDTLEKAFGRFSGLRSRFGNMFSQVSSMLGGAGMGMEDMSSKLDSTKKIIEEVNKQFKNPELTTFVPVMIPEFLSLYETERLISQLFNLKIDVRDIVINQILFPESESHCKLCLTRTKMQDKYISQADLLYSTFHLIKLPLLQAEVRGVPALHQFSKNLMTPYAPPGSSGTSTTTAN
eukprot:TRINITY_DN5029_c0_g1_i1.p1 TRINITY_DN5029_c0_g1~~TRINITY_DN5029_c0_g1_i1.p1  ORF type:complete len:360 (+),score=105.40 TRINITY_DN5029_c0_g1_i1:30-1082(+)